MAGLVLLQPSLQLPLWSFEGGLQSEMLCDLPVATQLVWDAQPTLSPC